MAARNKRKADWDPLKSDSDDEDYGEETSPKPRSKARSRKSTKSGSRSKPPAKRRRETYDDDDISLDDDEISEDDEFDQSSRDEAVIERNPRTGRGVRASAKKEVNYEENSDEEGIEDTDEDSRPVSRRGKRAAPPAKKESLVIKLKVPKSAGKSRPASRGMKREPTPQAQSAAGTRRSSRISHDDQQPLVALTDSGRNEVVTRAGTTTPEPQQLPRPTRGSKGLRSAPQNVPSAIMEASQEDSQGAAQPADEQDYVSQLQAAASQDEVGIADTQPEEDEEIRMEDEGEDLVQESAGEENDEDEGPISRGAGRSLRRRKASTPPLTQESPQKSRRNLRKRKVGVEQSSDFEPDAEGEGDVDEDLSDSEGAKGRDRSSNGDSNNGRRSGRSGRKTASQRSRSARQPSEDELDPEEIADEAAELDEDNRRNRRSRKRTTAPTDIAFETTSLRRRGKQPDYRIYRPETLLQQEEDDAPAMMTATPSKARRGGGGGGFSRSLFSTFGPFGGAGGPPPVFGEGAAAATGGVDSDSSDDEGNARGGQHSLGGTVGMTPTSAFPKSFLPAKLNSEPALQGAGGGPPGLGRVKDKKALADADPLGVDPNVTFDAVGGLSEQINSLKEMVALPLLYPEVFQRFHVTPPRGVLFHGPPGTGKTLMARALASSVSSGGKKVTFYMRKGADALSKWVGEAEKQLRLLFDEARQNQPSIIFFDEIDGLAPVRSSKQEQIHASIVATLLALMDGMDGRGQVIVIGATNRPDSVDPALRRPGRFDREFYFGLPDQISRRSIIDIHTKGWEPALKPEFKDQLAELTRGYAGADLRALCTEAALNAVQGTFPQIYSSDEKLQIDPTQIKVLAKDFMISVNKIVPASERSAASGAAALKKDIEPLLRKPLTDLTNLIDQAMPRKRKITALEEAMYDDRDDETGFERETMARQFQSSRVFRPRLLIKGREGMGQHYLGAALLSKLEGLHVQHFDLATLMKDTTRSVEAAIVQQFEEVKQHKPSVIYIPNVDLWYDTIGDSAIKTFTGLLRSLPPTEPVLLLGVMDRDVSDDNERDGKMLRDLFGYSLKNQYDVERPESLARHDYWKPVIDLIKTAPPDFPEPENRKKRKLAELPVAPPPPPPPGPTKADLKAQKKADRQTLNYLKIHLQSVMDQIKLKYKKFRTPVVDESVIGYLYDEQDPEVFTTDLTEEQRQQQQLFRPYELDKDEKGVQGLREVATGKFYYNMEIVTIEKRLSNGYYKRAHDFLADIKRMAKDAKTLGDEDRTIKANELVSNVEVDVHSMETSPNMAWLVAACEAVYQREQERVKIQMQEQNPGGAAGSSQAPLLPPPSSKATTESSGPITLGQQVPGRSLLPLTPAPTSTVRPPHPSGPDVSPKSYTGSLTNGSHHTNGSSVPSKPQEDVEMPDSQPADGQGDSHGWPNTQGQRSQTSAHTRIAPGSQIDQYHNSASTTTSGQKTSDKSRSSGLNTQNSNGIRPTDGPDWSDLPMATGGSQLPDTQDPVAEPSFSQSQPSQASQPMAPPAAPAQRQSVHALLNDMPEGASRMLIELGDCQMLHDELTKNSSGMSVEQLEQINASLMDVIWRQRGEWNRNKVIHAVQKAFNETVDDIEQCQNILNPSQQK